jgi:hypothetical protein
MNLFLGGLLLIISVAGVWIFWRPLRAKDPTIGGGGGYTPTDASSSDSSSSHDGHS